MRDFSSAFLVQYRGAIPVPNAINIGGVQGAAVALTFDWAAYGANQFNNRAVNVNLANQTVAAKLKQIRTIYIDNMGSDTPIYAYFPDTNYRVVAQPNSAGWFKVYTNGLQLHIIGIGFNQGALPTTYILVTNANVENAVDIELQQSLGLQKASSIITRGGSIYSTDFGIPALGDQPQQFGTFVSADGVVFNNFWTSPLASGFIYLSNLELSLAHLEANNATQGSITVVIESTGISGLLYSFPFLFVGKGFGVAPVNIGLVNSSGMNVKLDGTQTWRVRAENMLNATSGLILLNSTFTTNPK